jgi:hypothetical protein
MDTTLARLKVGQLLDGRYRVDARIARGGMATVYLGRLRGAAGFARLVAVKQLHPHFLLYSQSRPYYGRPISKCGSNRRL